VPGPATLTAHCPAKLNLFLEVLGKRPDGFHEIDSVMHPLPGLHDVLVVTAAEPGVMELKLESPPWWKVPAGEENLALRAARMVLAEARAKAGFRMRLRKRIPPGSGLGGGSSDAAAALQTINSMLGDPVPRKRLEELAAGLGSDVPFFLHAGSSRARGRGEKLEVLRAGPIVRFLIAWPGVPASTTEVYARCKPAAADRRRDPKDVIAALAAGNARDLAKACFNRLEAAAREVCPAVLDARMRLEALQLGPVRVTGSGSACFVVLVPGGPQGAWAGEA
jgi:4-diphosphocytidyl-2-C-methyl-D-erythritol kinase